MAIAAGAVLAFGPSIPRRQPEPGQNRFFPLRVTWSADLDGEPVAALVTDERRVYVPLRGGRVAAHARADGKPVWTAQVQTRFALATDGRLLFAGAEDGLRAFRTSDGRDVWRASIGDVSAAPVATGGWVIVGTPDGDVRAFRGDDGSLVWRRGFRVPLAAATAIEGSQLYLPLQDGRLVAVEITSGATLWERTLDAAPGGILALGDHVYAGARDNYLYSLAPRDGEVLWRWRTAADVVEQPAVDDTHVFFVSFDNVLRALDRNTGVQRWHLPLSGRHLGGPQVVGDLVMVTVPSSRLSFCLARSGRAVADIELPAPMVVAPTRPEATPRGGGVYVATIDAAGQARLHALGPADDPPLVPLERLPGRPVRSEVPPAMIGRPTKPPALPLRLGRGG